MTGSSLGVLQVCSASSAVYGAAHSLLTLAKAQGALGKRVEFATFAGRKLGAQVRELGFRDHPVKVRAKVDPLAIASLARVIRDGRFDVVHTHLSTSSVNGALAARLARVPSVATVHGMSGKLSFAAANHLIAVSQGVKRHLVAQGVPATKITVVYNGIELSESLVSKCEARDQLGLNSEWPVLGTVSRVTKLKGVADALKAVAILRTQIGGLRYVVVGDGNALESCRALAAELEISDCVRFMGYRSDVGACLAAFDLFVFPTLKEAMGLSLVEAMAAGLPVVATDVGGIPEVVADGTGVLVGAGKPEELAAAIANLLKNPGLMAAMGSSARRRVEEVFGVEAMEAGTDAVYKELLASPA